MPGRLPFKREEAMTDLTPFLSSVFPTDKSIELTLTLCHRVARQRMASSEIYTEEIKRRCEASEIRGRIPHPCISAYAHGRYNYEHEFNVDDANGLPFALHSSGVGATDR